MFILPNIISIQVSSWPNKVTNSRYLFNIPLNAQTHANYLVNDQYVEWDKWKTISTQMTFSNTWKEEREGDSMSLVNILTDLPCLHLVKDELMH